MTASSDDYDTRHRCSLQPPTTAATLIIVVALASLADIKPGDFVGIASLPKPSGGDAAIGRTLTLAFKGGEKTISVPEGIPIVTFAPAREADLKPGAAVFIPAQRGSDGALASVFVVVGANGVAPPM